MEMIELRSDTCTLPTKEMRKAMAQAEVGNDGFGEDATVNALEEKAAELLAQTDMQITQICLACGFSHISYFGKVFRQQYGLSPKQFRELST